MKGLYTLQQAVEITGLSPSSEAFQKKVMFIGKRGGVPAYAIKPAKKIKGPGAIEDNDEGKPKKKKKKKDD